jgi:hypothetical protein
MTVEGTPPSICGQRLEIEGLADLLKVHVGNRGVCLILEVRTAQ